MKYMVPNPCPQCGKKKTQRIVLLDDVIVDADLEDYPIWYTAIAYCSWCTFAINNNGTSPKKAVQYVINGWNRASGEGRMVHQEESAETTSRDCGCV